MKVTKLLLCDRMTAELLLLMLHFQQASKTEQLLLKNFFYWMHSSESEKMTVQLQLNNFCKEVFRFNVYFRKWQNDCYETRWQYNFHFLGDILKWHTKLNNFWFNAELRKRRNDCWVTKWQLNFHCFYCIFKWHTKLNNFCKRSFWFED